MSGGHFDYNQYRINDIIDVIERELNTQGKQKDELWNNSKYYKKYSEELTYSYPIEIQNKFKEAIKYLKIAQIYVHRIDWLLSGDDGEETFLKRLKEDLDENSDIQ